MSLRYHIVSLSAALLALALGIVLGSTTGTTTLLSGLGSDRDLSAEVEELESERNALDARLDDADAFARAVAPEVVADSLEDRSVVVFSTDSASESDRDAIVELIETAGARVSGQVQLTDQFTDPSESDRLVELVSRLQPSGSELPTSGAPGTLAGSLLGQALLLDAESAEEQSTSDERTAVFSGLADGGFVLGDEDLDPAQLAIVLDGAASEQVAGARAATIARFATELERSGAGTVLVGGPGSGGGSESVGIARADEQDEELSTVDDGHTAAGRVAAVLALQEQLDGEAGHYGVAGNATAHAPTASGS